MSSVVRQQKANIVREHTYDPVIERRLFPVALGQIKTPETARLAAVLLPRRTEIQRR